MNEEKTKRINIVNEVEGVITFEKIEDDSLSREDVLNLEKGLSDLEAAQISVAIDIDKVKIKLANAKEIIALADAKLAEAKAIADNESLTVEQTDAIVLAETLEVIDAEPIV